MGAKPNTAEKNRLQLAKSEARQARVIRLYFQGMRVHQIAKRMKISDRTVLRDIDRARAEWRETAGKSYDEHLPEKLAEIEQIKTAAWRGWAKSLADEEEYTEESSEDGHKVRKKRRGQSGNPQFLNVLSKQVELECQLRGMLDPKPSTTVVVPVVEVIVKNREEKDQFETLTAEQFAKRLTG